LKEVEFLKKIRGEDVTSRSPQMEEQGKSRANQPGVLVSWVLSGQ
jgi:hypothetical protein